MTDFSKCEFINEIMSFYTYYDFCDDCKRIKKLYQALDRNAKLFYKWYLYANTHIDLYYKNIMWEYLNNEDKEIYNKLIELKKKYKSK